MRRVVTSIVFATVLADAAGIMLRQVFINESMALAGFISIRGVVTTGVAFSVVVNLLFFYIRRWGGCIEKLGGLTFTLFGFLTALMGVSVLSGPMGPWGSVVLRAWAEILLVQFALIGLVTTIALRTKNFTPPKPGEPLRW